MNNWRPHTQHPDGLEVAVIAVLPSEGAFDEGSPYLTGELYQWNVEHRCWMGETSGLLLKHAVYWWLPETELLSTLPS